MSEAGIGFGVIFSVVGMAVALQNGLPLVRANASRRWPTIIGRVRSAEVQSYQTQMARGSYSGSAPVIGFEYTVDGQHFERTAFVSGGSRNADDAREALRRYHIGQQVSVRYDPSRPSRAAMEGEYMGGSHALTFFASILCVFGALLVVSSL